MFLFFSLIYFFLKTALNSIFIDVHILEKDIVYLIFLPRLPLICFEFFFLQWICCFELLALHFVSCSLIEMTFSLVSSIYDVLRKCLNFFSI